MNIFFLTWLIPMSYHEELLIRIRSAYDSGGFNKLDADLSRAKRGHDQLAANSTKNTNTIKSNMNSAAYSTKSFGSTVVGAFDGIGGAITGMVAGFGLMTMVTTAWTGATQAQLNQMLLTKKYGADMAQSLVKNIQEIVAAVPGDDTFMNAFLSGVARVGNIADVSTLKNVAYIASDYMNASLAAGKMGYEIQQDLTKYILYGNTAELERGSILSAQVDSLKNKATIEERVLAMNEAMKKLGLDGLSQLDSASNRWEEVKGNIQLILTQFGTGLLPYIQGALNLFLDVNESTGGWAARLVVISGIIIALIPIIGMMAGPFATGATLIGSMGAALGGLKTTILGTAAAEKVLTSAITPADAAMGNLNVQATQGTSRLRAFATSAAGVTLGLAAMVLALIGVAYYISQANSATVAWSNAEKRHNEQKAAYANNDKVLNNQLQDLTVKRNAATKAGESTFLIDQQIAAKRLEIANNTNLAADAEKKWTEAQTIRQGLKDLGSSRGTDAMTKGAAAARGQTPEEYLQSTGMDPETESALIKEAELQNRINAPKLTYAGTMERINQGQDTYARKMKDTHGLLQAYDKDYQDYIRSNQAFQEAMDKGDIGGMIKEGVMSGFFQAKVGLTEMSVSFNSWAEDTSNAIQKPFQEAYIGITSWWNGLGGYLSGAWNDITSGVKGGWDDVVNYFNDKGTIGGQVYDGLKKIYCIIMGCSPGIVPALQQLYFYTVFVFNAMLSPIIMVKNTIEGFVLYIMLRMALLQNDIITKWNLVKAIVGVWIQTGISIFTDPLGWAKDRYNDAKSFISPWIGSGVNVATNAIKTAWDYWERFKKFVQDPVKAVVDVVYGSNAGSPTEVDYLYGQGPLYEPILTPSSVTTVGASTTSKIIISPVFNIESINSREEADYVIQRVTKELSDLNDSKGR